MDLDHKIFGLRLRFGRYESMANQSSLCPSPSFPGVLQDSPAHTLAIAVIILFPFYILLLTLVFWYYRKFSVFLRKRPFKLYLLTCLGTFVTYFATVVYDYLGSDNYNCALLEFLTYLINPAISYPLLLKNAGYEKSISLTRLVRQIEKLESGKKSSLKIEDSLLQGKSLKGDISLQTFIGHVKFTFFYSRSIDSNILDAKFVQTIGFHIFWFFLISFPFLLAFFIRIGMNPQWIHCTGCEIQTIDCAILLGMNIFVQICGLIANPKFIIGKISRHDALRINQECYYGWQIGGLLFSLSLILFLADPGRIYFGRHIFNWRFIIMIACFYEVALQTFYPIYVAKRMKQLVLVSNSALLPEEQLNNVLADKDLSAKLQKFLDSELSGEILEFILLVENYRQYCQQQQDENAKHLASHIYQTYINSLSPKELNLSSQVRQKLIQLFSSSYIQLPPDIELFNEAYIEIKKNLLVDGFIRFLRREQRDEKKITRMKSAMVVTN